MLPALCQSAVSPTWTTLKPPKLSIHRLLISLLGGCNLDIWKTPRNQDLPVQTQASGKASSAEVESTYAYLTLSDLQPDFLAWTASKGGFDLKYLFYFFIFSDSGGRFAQRFEYWAVDSSRQECTIGLDTDQLLCTYLPVHQVTQAFAVVLCEPNRKKVTEFPLGISKTWQMLVSVLELFANWEGRKSW